MNNDAIPTLTAFDEGALDLEFGALEKRSTDEAAAIADPDDVEAFRLRWVGRKGRDIATPPAPP